MNSNAKYINKPTYIINNYFNNSDIFITGIYTSQNNDKIMYGISKSKPNKYTVLLHDINDDFKSLATRNTNIKYMYFTASLNEMNDFINNIVNKNKKWKIESMNSKSIEIPGTWTSMTGGYKTRRKRTRRKNKTTKKIKRQKN